MASLVELTTNLTVGVGEGMTFGVGAGVRAGAGIGVDLALSASVVSRPVSSLFVTTEVGKGAVRFPVSVVTAGVGRVTGESSSRLGPSAVQPTNNASPAARSNPKDTDLAAILSFPDVVFSRYLFRRCAGPVPDSVLSVIRSIYIQDGGRILVIHWSS